jgi:hypothetical protein
MENQTTDPEENQTTDPKPVTVPAPPEEPEFDWKSLADQEFTSTLQEVHFKIDGKPYILREMSGTLRDEYHNQLFGEYMVREGDIFVTRKHEGLYAILLSRSIIGPDGSFVSFDAAKAYPSKLQTDLYYAARAISKLDRKKAKADAAKNS